MTIKKSNLFRSVLLILFLLLCGGMFALHVKAQNPEMQQKIAELKESMAKSKQQLAQYTWNEQVTISLKGEVKKVQHYQVRLGPDGKPQKTSLDQPAAPPEGGRLKKRIIEKKKEEYEDYAEQMKATAQQYVPPDKDLIQQAYAAGNVMMGPAAGVPNQIQIVFKNYVKPGDSMTIVYDKAQKQIVSIQIASYMNEPSDAMKLSVQFSKLPDGTNHVSGMVIDGVSKQLNIATQNSNYQHL